MRTCTMTDYFSFFVQLHLFAHTQLQFVAATNLDVATFQVSYQMKVSRTLR